MPNLTINDPLASRIRDLARRENRDLESILEAMIAAYEEELADEERWDQTFARSKDVLVKMAKQALKDNQEGNTEELDLDKL